MTLDQWKDCVTQHALGRNEEVQFTLEDGSGKTYGEPGDWTAHIGPDMQEDVVGVYTADGFWWYFDVDDEMREKP